MKSYYKYFIYGAIVGFVLLILGYGCTLIFPAHYSDNGYWEHGICEINFFIVYPATIFLPLLEDIAFKIRILYWIIMFLSMTISYGLIFLFIGTIIESIKKLKK